MKAFFERLMQVIWILTIILLSLSIIHAVTSGINNALGLLFCVIWIVILLIVQYLFYATLNPNSLFSGKKFFSYATIICVLSGLVIGVSINAYNSYLYEQKLKNSNDVSFFNEHLDKIVSKYDTTTCMYDNDNKVSREEFKERVYDLNSQGLSNFHAIVVLADNHNDLGYAIRCSAFAGLDINDLNEIVNN